MNKQAMDKIYKKQQQEMAKATCDKAQPMNND